MTETALSRTSLGGLWVTAALSLAPLALAQPRWIAFLSATLLALYALLWLYRLPLPSRRLVNALALAGSLAIFFEYRTLFGLRAGLALLCLFLPAQLFVTRRRREGLTVILLSWFLILARFIDDQTPTAAALAFFAALVSLATLSRCLAPALELRAHARALALLCAQSAPLFLVLFLFMPRVPGPLWGLPQDARKGVSGLAEEMTPGSLAELALSEAVAFRVRFAQTPPRHALYFRGPVLERFDGRTWRMAPARERPAPPLIASSPDLIDYEITLEPHRQRWLLPLDWPLEIPPDAHMRHDFHVEAKQAVLALRRDRFRSASTPPFVEEATEVLQENLRLPLGSNPRTQALAASWRPLPPAQRVEAALDHFRRGGFVYTLRPPPLGEHSVDEFLFETRRGFCEHFAAAFVVLMRAADVPARVVTGYQGGSHNPIDDTWVVRQADAHAWAEVWIAGAGWRRVDPTALAAPQRLEADLVAALPVGDPVPLFARAGFDWLRTLRFHWWALQNGWNQWVLGYTADRQRQMLARFGLQEGDWRHLVWFLGIGAALALSLLAWTASSRKPRLDPAQRLWRAFLRRLARKGEAPAPWEGPLAFAKRAALRWPEKAAEIERIARLYAGLRYGKLGEEALEALRRAVLGFHP
ncbi:MAG: DUF3488 and transglutaminase-like domain-containing protein [Rhodocyclaceae bacterium]|nr:DUF3488 and transglutaminase-like domain-containing protein [Rhodocyclaceae bacterium]